MKNIIKIYLFIEKNVDLVHYGQATDKLAAAVKLAWIPAIFFSIGQGFSAWYMLNYWYMAFVLFAIGIDHILGTWVHYFIKKDFDKKKNIRGFFTKLIVSIIGYAIFIMIHEIMKEVAFVAIYFKIVIQLMVFVYPASSIVSNLRILSEGRFPPDWMYGRWNKFQKTGDINNFKFQNDEKELSDSNDSNVDSST